MFQFIPKTPELEKTHLILNEHKIMLSKPVWTTINADRKILMQEVAELRVVLRFYSSAFYFEGGIFQISYML